MAVYAPVRNHSFISWDDPEYVTENPHVAAGLTRESVAWAFSLAGHGANWHPLTSLSHMADVELFGMRAGPQHLVNVGLHSLSTLLLFGALLWMTGALGRSLFVAALFAVHPLHVESVAWVSERKDVLSGLFFMLTLGTYAWYVRRRSTGRYVLVAVSLGLGLMSKAMLVTLPFVLLLIDVWPLDRTATGSGPARDRTVSLALSLLPEKLPLLGLSVVSSVLTVVVQRRWGAVAGTVSHPVGQRLANAVFSYGAYIGKMLWPARLAVSYPYPRVLPVRGAALCLVLLATVTLAVLWFWRRHPYLLVGWLWYFGTLVPVIGLVQVGEQALADRYTYLPLIGLLLLVSWGGYELASRLPHRDIVLSAATSLVVLACIWASRAQVQYWRSSETLWQHALAVTDDNYVAHHRLGLVLYDQGKLDEAVAHFKEALHLRPTYADAHSSLGVALAKQDRIEQALAEFREALRLRPDDAGAHNNLGTVLARLGRLNEAIEQYNAALKINPLDPDPHFNLGVVLAQQGRLNEAIAQYREALRLHPSDVDARHALQGLLGGSSGPPVIP